MRILILVLGLLVGCAEHKVSQGGLTEDRFVDLCVDVLALQSDTTLVADSLLVARDAVFNKHEVTQEEVTEFIANRRDDPDAWVSVMTLLKERLGKQADIPLRAFQRGGVDSVASKKARQ